EGMVGALRGLAVDEVAEAAHRVATAEAALAELAGSLARRQPPLERLAGELALSPLAREILLVIAAPALWGEVARLYGILADDEHRPLCDEHVVATILGARASPYEIAEALDAGASLLRHGLVRLGAGTGRPFLALSIDRVALILLRGASPDGELAPAIQ